MIPNPSVILKWTMPFGNENGIDGSDERWDSYGIYAYLRPRNPEILYIGKADGRNFRQRVYDPDKNVLFDGLRRQRGITGIRVIVAEVEATQRVTKALILDVESLLIHEIKPCGNRQSVKSRGITRPGLTVICRGECWPFPRRTFHDY
jgi:hypothetical protein